MRIGAFAACAIVFVATSARADDDEANLSVAANVGYETTTGGLVEAALRGVAGNTRFGGIAQLGLSSFNGDVLVDARPLVTLEYRLHHAADFGLWIGAAFGPWFQLVPSNATIGFTALGTVDIVIPLGRVLAFDVIVRAGGQIFGQEALQRPGGIGQFALGLSWDFGGVRPLAAPR